MKEKDAIVACQKGQVEGCTYLYENCVDKIYRYVFLRVRHRETAEDIVSDVFMKAFGKMSTFDSDRPFLPWLYRVAENTIIDHWRKERPTSDIDDAWDIADTAKLPDEQSEDGLRETKVKTMLKALSPIERTVLTLRLWDDLSYRSIGEATGKTEEHAKVIFSRAIAKLRKHYDE